MLIVSQDKKAIHNFKNILSLQIENNKIIVYDKINDGTSLGKYETEKRAKKVLQEIINTFSCNEVSGKLEEIRTLIEFKKISRYEMPKE